MRAVISVEITCAYQKTSWVYIGDHYQCEVIVIRVDEPNEVVQAINGTHMAGMTADDVRSIYITDKILRFFPKGFDTFFKNIESIQIYNSKLRSITKEDLRPFPRLKDIYLQMNRISVLGADLFHFNPELRRMFFDFNRIRVISSDIFDPIDDLDSFHFTGNICTSKNGQGQKEMNEFISEIVKDCQSSRTDIVSELQRMQHPSMGMSDTVMRMMEKLPMNGDMHKMPDMRNPMERFMGPKYLMDRFSDDRRDMDRYNNMQRYPMENHPPMDHYSMDRHHQDPHSIDRYHAMDRHPQDHHDNRQMDRLSDNRHPADPSQAPNHPIENMIPEKPTMEAMPAEKSVPEKRSPSFPPKRFPPKKTK